VTVWAQVRAAPPSGARNVQLQYQPRGTSAWGNQATLQTSNPEGILETSISLPSAGAVRLAWRDPVTGTTYFSRVASVS
jgi:hypothetical protein